MMTKAESIRKVQTWHESMASLRCINHGSRVLKDLFHTATAQSHFSINGSSYDQVDGVAMGPPSHQYWPIFLWVIMGGSGYKIFVFRRFCSTGGMSRLSWRAKRKIKL